MKLTIDERLKHRLVGIAVLVSIAAIFVPAIMKKSNQRFDKSTIAIKLPPKPSLPQVTVPTEANAFRQVKVAHVEIPAIKDEEPLVSSLAKAEPLKQINNVTSLEEDTSVKLAEKALVQKSTKTESFVEAERSSSKKPVVTAAKKMAPSLAKTKTPHLSRYSVQLATFTNEKNATLLVSKLKNKGYHAFSNKITTSNGTVYKVLVGQENKRQNAQQLLQQIATAMQMKGFIVSSTGIS